MLNLTYDAFLDYLNSKEIIKLAYFNNIEEEVKQSLNVSIEEASKQIEVISEFHKKVMGFSSMVNRNIPNCAGRTLEKYKMESKKLKKIYKKIQSDNPTNDVEKLILNTGEKMIKRGEACIKTAKNSDYLSLLQRSMNRNEICLGDVDFSNLRKRKYLEVISLEHCCYDMVEMDYLKFLLGLRRSGISMDYTTLIEYLCKLEGLNQSSKMFILSLMSFPHKYIRCCIRYSENKRNWSQKEFLDRMQRALQQDAAIMI